MMVCEKNAVENRKIALIGDGHICRRFFLQFQSSLNIQYLFHTNLEGTSGSADSFFKEGEKVRCMPINSSVIREQNLLLILCVEHALRASYDTLLFNMGLLWGVDYVDFRYVIQYYRNKYNIAMDEMNIWIFGAGNNGRYFYDAYKEIFHIRGFLSNFENEKEYMGLQVIRPSDMKMKKDYFVVICSDADELMSRQLGEMGMTGGKDFGFAELLPGKLFIAVGICQITKTAKTLAQNLFFNRRYQMDIYFQTAYEPFSDADNRRVKEYGIFCDVVFYNVANAGTNEFYDYEPVLNQYYRKAIRFFMPFYFFNGQLMQATEGLNPYAIRIERLNGGWHYWFRGDKEINKMIEANLSVDDIVQRVTGEYWCNQDIKDNFVHALKRIEVLDRFSSFPVRDFIEENYKRILIFIDGTHFSYQLCLYLANEIAKSLGVQPMEDQGILNEGEYTMTSVMPIYPCVKRALGIERGEHYQYYNPGKNTVENVDIQQYAERYAHYVLNIREIYEKTGAFMGY